MKKVIPVQFETTYRPCSYFTAGHVVNDNGRPYLQITHLNEPHVPAYLPSNTGLVRMNFETGEPLSMSNQPTYALIWFDEIAHIGTLEEIDMIMNAFDVAGFLDEVDPDTAYHRLKISWPTA